MSKDTNGAPRAKIKKAVNRAGQAPAGIVNAAIMSHFLNDEQREKLEKVSMGRCNITYISSFDEVESLLPEQDVLIGTPPPEEDFFSRAERLKWLQSPYSGVNEYIDMIAGRKDIVLTNASGAYGHCVSEYMLTYTLILLKNIREYLKAQETHEWQREIGVGREIYGSNVAVVGLGDIGGAFAKKMFALGAHVRGVKYSHTGKRNDNGVGNSVSSAGKPDYLEKLYTKDHIDKALEGADIVALCLPDTPKTTGIMSRERIFSLKENAVLINVGRGSAIDQVALCDALRDNRIYAGVDVTAPEPLPQVHRMWNYKNVIITPHVAGCWETPSAARFIGDLIVRNMDAFLTGRPLENLVDTGRGY